MPHISKRKLSLKTIQAMEDKIMLFLSSPSMRTRQEIFQELFTETERIMVAKRLAILFFVTEGKSTYEISNTLGVSTSTISRFEHAIDKGKFGKTTAWLKRNKQAHGLLSYIANLVSVPFDAQKKSLHRLADEL